MPELPEVETTRAGVAPLIENRQVTKVEVRDYRLRRSIDRNLGKILTQQKLLSVTRRAKYLLCHFEHGTLLIHLGMSGSLRVVDPRCPPQKHDHVDVEFDRQYCLRFRDPRRFGLMVWTSGNPHEHALIEHLGPEPWASEFHGRYLHERSRGRKVAVKNFIMDGRIVVGVGNIYASESLYRAGIHPNRAAQRISRERYVSLAENIQLVLDHAIAKGGTTLQDFQNADGKPGYFRHELKVYDRAGLLCECGDDVIRQMVIGQRSSFYCPSCQR